jgi:L-ribulokinase
MKRTYTIGVDYGTESGRVLLVDIATGEEVAVHVTPCDEARLGLGAAASRRLHGSLKTFSSGGAPIIGR